MRSKRLCWRAASSKFISTAQAVARGGSDANQRRAVSGQELLHALRLTQILFAADNLLAGAQAPIHFAIDAARMLRAGLQIFLAAPHLEQIQKLIFEQLRGGSGLERAVMNRAAGAQARLTCVRGNSFARISFT